MVEIEIHFTEGFNADTVNISSEGRELLRAEQLTTDPRTDLARIARVAVAPGRSTLTIQLPSGDLAATTAIDTATLKFLTIARAGGGLKVDPVTVEDYRREPRGYT